MYDRGFCHVAHERTTTITWNASLAYCNKIPTQFTYNLPMSGQLSMPTSVAWREWVTARHPEQVSAFTAFCWWVGGTIKPPATSFGYTQAQRDSWTMTDGVTQ